MLDPALIPTPLIEARERLPVEIRPPVEVTHRTARVFLAFLPLAAACVGLAIRRRLTAAEVGRRARRFVERLGGFWVKLAQLVSLRHDLYPAEFCFELMKVQDQASGFPGELAMAIVEEDLGRPIGEFFTEFDRDPIAAASIGQVHVATLAKEGCRVAVKVQRPGIAEGFAADMRVLHGVLWLLRRFRRLYRLRLDEVYFELNDALEEELDYRREAFHIRQMRRVLDRMDVLAPKTWKAYNRRRVLVMEYFDCVFMSDYLAVLKRDPERVRAWLAENDIDPGRLGRKLYHSFLRQVLEEPYFHSDLHPGNIALFRGGRIGLIDFGAVGIVFGDYRRPMIRYIRTMSEHDYRETVERMMYMFEPIPPIDVDEFKRQMQRVMMAWDANTRIPTLPFHQKSSMYLYTEMGRVAMRFNMPFDWTYMRIDRANITMNTSLMHLAPDLEFPREMAKFFEGYTRRQLAKVIPTPDGVASAAVALRNAGRRVSESVDNVEELFKRSSLSMQATTSKVAFAFLAIFRIGRTLLDGAGLFLALAFVHQWFAPIPVETSALVADDLVARLPRLGAVDWLIVYVLWASFRRMFVEATEILGRKDGGSYRM